MRILITGASGNLGSRLIPVIYDLYSECGILLRPTSVISSEISSLGNLTILRSASESETARFVEAFKPDLVIHTACNYGLNGECKSEISRVNIDLGLSIIKSLDFQSSLKTFVNVGTALPSGLSNYAESKHQFSRACIDIAASSFGHFKFINLITQTIYGPSLDQPGFISHIINECLKTSGDLKLTLGYQKRDFIHVDDVVGAIKTIILNLKNHNLKSEYELGSGESRSIREVVTLIHSLTRSRVNLAYGALPYRQNEPMNLVANVSSLRSLGWIPSVKFEEGIQKMLLKQDEITKTLS